MARPAAQRVTAPWYDAEEADDFRVAYGFRYENQGDRRNPADYADRARAVSGLAARAMRDGDRTIGGTPRWLIAARRAEALIGGHDHVSGGREVEAEAI